MLRISFVISLLLFLMNAASSQRGNNWYFGNKAALKFTPTGPINVSGSAMITREGCSTISDENGNLLFYTDGVGVWNKNNTLMANGSGLRGNLSSAQSSIVVPDPGNSNRYYLFTSVQQEAGLNLKVNCYNIIDMSLQGGLGEVVIKNVVFDTLCSERLTAAIHNNGTDFWIITNPQRTNTFKSFLLSPTGLSNSPVISNVGKVINESIGMIKVSNNGQWLVQTTFVFSNSASPCQLFNFNNNNGQVNNPINLIVPNNFNCSYGCAFSPNNKRLYITCFDGEKGILQYSLNSNIDSNINKSRAIINVVSNSIASRFGDLSVGEDGRMYIARTDSKRLSCITNPNDSGNSINFIDSAFLLQGDATCISGLPNFYNAINISPSKIVSEKLGCLTYKFSLQTANTFPFRGIYRWDFGDGSPLSTDSTPTHSFRRTLTDSFLVTLNFRSPDNTVSINQEAWISLPPRPKAIFFANINGCLNDTLRTVNTSSSTNGKITNYAWSFGDGTTSIAFEPAKKYIDTGRYIIKLSVTDTLGCLSDTNFISIYLNKKVVANFQLQGAYCIGNPLQLNDSSIGANTTINNWNYSWNNGSSFTSSANGNFTPSFTTEGLYTIKLVTKSLEGCISDTATKSYFIYNKPKTDFILPKNCVLDISQFINNSTIIGASSINNFKWNFGVNSVLDDTSIIQNPSYQYNAADTYPVKLIIKTNQGCTDSLIQNFTVNGAIPKAKLSFAVNPICSGDSIILLNQSSVNFGNISKMEIKWGATNFEDTAPTPNNSYKFKFIEFGNPSTVTQPIKIKAFSGINCVNEVDTFIVLKAQPRVNFVLPIDSICGNELSFILNQGVEINGATGFERYSGTGVRQLNTNSYEFSPSSILPNSLTSINFRFTTPEGCLDSVSQFVRVLPFPIANAGENRILIKGESIVLNATAIGSNLNYSWTPALFTNNPNILQPTVKATSDTTMLLKVTNNIGCFDTSRMFVDVVEQVIPPNAFSPNFDGINDTWIIPNINLYPNCDVSIFNRNGQLLFKSKGYNKPWNGTRNSSPLPTGTYYYIISLSKEKALLSGWVQILR